MYDIDTKGKFLELRAKGWSLARITKRLKVAQRTLVDWNREEQEQIRSLRAIELEALHFCFVSAPPPFLCPDASLAYCGRRASLPR